MDVDKDGDLDVAVAVEYGANRLYLNDGKGQLTWQEGALGKVSHDSEHVLSEDFNRDGFMDLIFVAEDDATNQIFFGGPEGRFIEASDRAPRRSEGNALAIGDVDGDGLPDIVIGSPKAPVTTVAANGATTSVTYTAPVTNEAAPESAADRRARLVAELAAMEAGGDEPFTE